MMKRIRIEKVTKRFGEIVAVDNVSLEVEGGEVFFLLGPSGCGKTTLLRIVAGLTDPDSGRILIGNEDVTHRPPHLRRTAMVFQNYALWPHMTVASNVEFPMAMQGISRAKRSSKMMEVLKIVRMEWAARKKPAQLSGGEQQRVALARSIAASPVCLLLDEPLSNLDAALRNQMRSEIRRICKETGITTIYVTHDQKEALSIADRVAVMNRGLIEQVAAPRELYDRPATKFVAEFVGETNFIRCVVERIGGGEMLLRAEETLLLSSVFPPNLREGDTAVCSMRPEALVPVRPEEARRGEPGWISGRLLRSTFLGELTQHEVEVAGTRSIKVTETSIARVREPGSEVILHVKPKDVIVYTG